MDCVHGYCRHGKSIDLQIFLAQNLDVSGRFRTFAAGWFFDRKTHTGTIVKNFAEILTIVRVQGGGKPPPLTSPAGARCVERKLIDMAKGSKKGACSANVQPAKMNCLEHNRRNGQSDKHVPSYVNPHLSDQNHTIFEDDMIKGRKSIVPFVKRAELLYTEKTGQKCQKSFVPFREDVLSLPGRGDITDEQIMNYLKEVESKYHIKPIGAWYHKDEGHVHSKYIEGDENFELNYHVHVLYSCQDPETGQSIKLPRSFYNLRQDFLANATGMERGNPASETGISRRSALQQRIHAQEARIDELERLAKYREDLHRRAVEAYEAKLKEMEGKSQKALDRMKADYESQIEKLEKRLERYDRRKEKEKKAEKEQHHSSSIFTSKSQKIINELEEKNKDLRDELMDVRMHSYGETSRKIANFWKEQCRALDPVLTADKEAQLTAAHQKSVEVRRTDIAIPTVSTRPVKEVAPKVKPVKSEDYMKSEIEKKWAEVIDFATQHATGKGSRTGILWLKDSFNEYLDMSDSTPGYNMGGQPGSLHNREVLAEKIRLELGNGIGGRHVLDDTQMAKLKESLSSIVQDQGQGLKRS